GSRNRSSVLLVLEAERVGERAPGVVERRLHGSGRDLQCGGDVGDREVVHVVQRDDLALAWWQRGDRAPELGVDRRERGERLRSRRPPRACTALTDRATRGGRGE